MILYKTYSALFMLCLLLLVSTNCSREDEVSFSQDVRPILELNCMACHQHVGAGQKASGFGMGNYNELMKGTRYGPMIIAGDTEGSNMVVLMEGRADPSISMPHASKKSVSKQDIQTIKSWISQGAKDN